MAADTLNQEVDQFNCKIPIEFIHRQTKYLSNINLDNIYTTYVSNFFDKGWIRLEFEWFISGEWRNLSKICKNHAHCKEYTKNPNQYNNISGFV